MCSQKVDVDSKFHIIISQTICQNSTEHMHFCTHFEQQHRNNKKNHQTNRDDRVFLRTIKPIRKMTVVV
jgi:hypothetical protein